MVVCGNASSKVCKLKPEQNGTSEYRREREREKNRDLCVCVCGRCKGGYRVRKSTETSMN